jgi:hypothetical protein
MSSPTRSNSQRALPSFLPLNPDPGWQMMSTRGQNLPGLIRRYSMSSDFSSSSPSDRHAAGLAMETGAIDDLEGGSSNARVLESSPLTNEPEQLSASSLHNDRQHRRGSLLIGDTKSPFLWYVPGLLLHSPCSFISISKLDKEMRTAQEDIWKTFEKNL